MEISYNKALFFSGLASLSLLTGAFSLEIFADLEPCKLCIWQRWPHAFIVFMAISGFGIIKKNWMLLLICLFAIITGIIGYYHAGVEQGWWHGPVGCSNRLGSEMDISSLTTLLLETPLVKCDEIVWSLFGISMAGWNSIISFCIALFSLFCWHHLTKKKKLYFS